MLSRTAETLYWMARYLERADNLARNLEVAHRLSLMPTVRSSKDSEWRSILETSGLSNQFDSTHSQLTPKNIEHFLIFDTHNPSSIANCIRVARNNGREVRTALTSDVWTALNKMYIEFNKLAQRSKRLELPEFCEWVKLQTATVRGSYLNTQLRNQGFDFYNLGLQIERADNTARLLDIKYYVLLPTIDMVGGGVDQYQWTTLLRAMSSYRAYYWLYSGDYSAEKIADFFILNRSCPRSLKFCLIEIAHHLDQLSTTHGRYNDAQMLALKLKQELDDLNIASIIELGLHEFLQSFIRSNSKLNDQVSTAFLFGGR